MIRPLSGQCLLEIFPPEEMTAGGLALPDISHDHQRGEKQKPSRARVLAVGPWRKTKQGFSVLPEFAPGDEVLISFYDGQKLTREIGENLRLVDVRDVLAKVEKKETVDSNGKQI